MDGYVVSRFIYSTTRWHGTVARGIKYYYNYYPNTVSLFVNISTNLISMLIEIEAPPD